jgi:SAM-dependent methyltransferase
MEDKLPLAPKYGSSERYLGLSGEEYFAWQSAKQDVGGRIEARKFLPYVKLSDTVLDFGCGGGFTLSNIPCARRIGVEINPAARAVAQRKGLECYSELDAVPDQTADVVISNHALEHVPYPIAALREMVRVLKSSGLLVLVLPLDDWRTQPFYDSSDINHHLYTWTPLLIGNALSEGGFQADSIQVRVLTHAWFPGYDRAFRTLPAWLFDFGCRMYSALRKRRQLLALAHKA